MSLFLTMREIRAETKLGVLAFRALTRMPYPLPFTLAPAA